LVATQASISARSWMSPPGSKRSWDALRDNNW
jgi:hypothetical protein